MACAISGIILIRWKAVAGLLGARYKRLEELSDDLDLKAWERRYKALAAEVEDVLERESRVSDRLRKRAQADDKMPREDVPNALTRGSPNGADFKSREDVMRVARERGMVKT